MSALTLLEHLDRAEKGLRVVQQIYDSSLTNQAAQWTHKFVSTDEYHCRHEREGCAVCDQYDELWKIVSDYKALVRGYFEVAQEAAEIAARERAELELGARIESETRDLLLSRPEIEATA